MTSTNKNRFQVVDFTRGIALLGILIMNIQCFSLFFFLPDPQQVYDLNLDRPATYAPTNFLVNLFISGQFYTMYSFLFGLGFYFFMEKYNGLEGNGSRLFKRRLWILLIIGLLHGLLIWFGDVLHKYALLGFTLLYFNKKSVSVLVKWIIGLMTAVIVILVVKYLFFVTAEGMGAEKQGMATMVQGIIKLWQHGSFFEVMAFQKMGLLVGHFMNISNGLYWYVHYEIMFLVGLIVGKLGLLNNISAYKLRFRRALFIVLPIVLLLKGASCLPLIGIRLSQNPVYEEGASMLMQFVAIPLLTGCYLVLLMLFFPAKPSGFYTWIANAGRMGLTNYLAQSVFCSIIFYGYGFGLAGKITLLQSLLVVLFIYLVQVLYSNLWLRYYAMGPMEKLWRTLILYKKSSPSGAVA